MQKILASVILIAAGGFVTGLPARDASAASLPFIGVAVAPLASPTVAISSGYGGSGSSTSATPIIVTATFSQDVVGVTLADLVVTNGTATSLDPLSDSRYRFVVTPTAAGSVTMRLLANAAQNAGGDNSLASPTFSLTYTTPALALSSLNPTRNARGVAASVSPSFTFGQSLNASAASEVRLFSAQRGGQLRHGARGTATVSGTTLTFNPTTNFQPGETVYSTLTTLTASTTSRTLAAGRVAQFTVAVGGTGRGNFLAPATNSETSVGSQPKHVALADVDNDGDLDMLTANDLGIAPGSVSIRLNNGSGVFSGSQDVAVGDTPDALALGDVDGDGDIDLLTANDYGGNASVRLNDGAGNFSGTQNVGLGGLYGHGVALGDVDGDGDLDLVAVRHANPGQAVVRLNDGAGNFSGTQNVGLGANYPYDVALGDVDGDGDLDLAAGSGSTMSIRLNGGDASGSNTGLFSNGSDVTVAADAHHVAFGDVDGDGDLDLLVLGSDNNGNVSIRFNNGSGTFSGTTNVAVGRYPDGLALADVDADNDLDLVVANSFDDNVSIRLNDGSGAFTAANGNSNPAVGNNPHGVALGDVDGDGDLDLVSANGSDNTVSLRLNQPPVPVLTSLSPGSGPVGQTVVLTGTNLTAATAVRFDGVAATITANTATSITVTVPTGGGNSVTVTTAGGTSNILLFIVALPPQVVSFTPTHGAVGTVVTVTGTRLSNATAVSFNGVAATEFRALPGGQQLSVRVPAGATTGLISVSTRYGSSSSSASFTVDGLPMALCGVTAAGAGSPLNFTTAFQTQTVAAGDRYAWTFVAGAGGIYSFSNCGGSEDTFLRVYDTGGNLLASVDEDGPYCSGSQASLDFTPGVSGTYTVVLSRFFCSTLSSTEPFAYKASQPPTTLGLSATSLNENVPAGTTVGTLTTTDPDDATGFAYTLVEGPGATDNAAFSLSGNQLVLTASPDYETQPSYAVRVRVTDPHGMYYERSFTIAVIDRTEITSLAPPSGPLGSTIVINGNQLSGATTITFSGSGTHTVTTGFVVNGAGTQITGVVVPSGTITGAVTVTAPGGISNGLTFTVAAGPTVTSLNTAAELPGMPVVITGTGFTAASTVTFGGMATSSVTYNSATSLTATVPAGAAVGSSAVVVTTSGVPSSGSPAFSVLAVYSGGTLGVCATAVPTTATTADGQWHYLLSSSGQVVLAYNYSGANLGSFGVSALRANPANPVRQDAHSHAYLDRNWRLTASTGTFAGRSVQLRFYGLTAEFDRLQAADPAVTYANLKATQYSGVNEDCELSDNDAATGEYRTLNLTASTPGNGVTWFVAQASVADHFSEFYLTGSTVPLPVELTAFTATAQAPNVQLSWHTASEENSARFEVERSLEGQQFSKMGEVAAQGTASSPTDYAYLDSQVPKNLSPQAPIYYRLRQVDLDGTTTFSPVRTVTLSGKALLTLYPNPAHGTVMVAGVSAGAPVDVFDALGRLVAAATADAAGTAQLALPSGLAAGVYVVRSGPGTLRLLVE